jgi:site-specific DNA recombinase
VKALLKATEAFEAGVNSLSDFAERKKVNEAKINQLKREIVDIESQLEGMMRYTKDEIQQLMNEFKDNWQQATTSKEQNQLLKSLVNRIWYDREGDTITFEIEYK